MKRHRFGSLEEIRAVFYSKEKGMELAETNPEMADEFRVYPPIITLEQLGEKYSEDYDISKNVARSCAWEALRILIKPKELEEICKRRNSFFRRISGRKGGAVTYKRGTGAFGISLEKRLEALHKAGKIGGAIAGKMLYEQGRGIFDKTNAREMMRKAVISRGLVPYDGEQRKTELGLLNEREYIVKLKQDGGYSWRAITSLTNGIFRNGRNRTTLITIYNSVWKKGS